MSRPPSSEPSAPRSSAPRFSLPLTADKSKIDLDKLQAGTRDTLRSLLSDPDLTTALQVAPINATPAVAAAEALSPELCGVIYDAVSVVLVKVAARAYPESVARLAAFTDEDKAALCPLTAKLIDRYLPGAGGKYQDEIMFGLMLTAIVSGKMAAINSAASKSSENTPA